MHEWALYIGCQLLCTIRYNIHITQLVSLWYFNGFLIPSGQTGPNLICFGFSVPCSDLWPWPFFSLCGKTVAAVHYWVVLTWRYDWVIIVFDCCCDRTFFFSATICFILVNNPLTDNCPGVADWREGNQRSDEGDTSLSPAQVTVHVHRTGAADCTHPVRSLPAPTQNAALAWQTITHRCLEIVCASVL